MDAKPLFSVITCTKNEQRHLQECLDSVARQSFKNFEHIFVDGYSTDRTIHIIEQYQAGHSKTPTRLISARPKGIANAMNIGIRHAKGEVICFLHADDYFYSKNSLGAAAKYFAKGQKTNWLVGNNVVRIGTKKIVWPWPDMLKPLYAFGSLYYHPNLFLRTSMFKRYGLFDESFKITMDYEHCLRMLKHEEPVFVNENFSVFRIHKGSTSWGSDPNNKLRMIRERIRAEMKNSDLVQKTKRVLDKEIFFR